MRLGLGAAHEEDRVDAERVLALPYLPALAVREPGAELGVAAAEDLAAGEVVRREAAAPDGQLKDPRVGGAEPADSWALPRPRTVLLSARLLLALLEECNPDASNDRAAYRLGKVVELVAEGGRVAAAGLHGLRLEVSRPPRSAISGESAGGDGETSWPCGCDELKSVTEPFLEESLDVSAAVHG